MRIFGLVLRVFKNSLWWQKNCWGKFSSNL